MMTTTQKGKGVSNNCHDMHMLTLVTDKTIHLGQLQDSKNQNKTHQSDTQAVTTNATALIPEENHW
jgi:hypothetical protein